MVSLTLKMNSLGQVTIFYEQKQAISLWKPLELKSDEGKHLGQTPTPGSITDQYNALLGNAVCLQFISIACCKLFVLSAFSR